MDYVIDAKGKRLGRLASEIAHILQGKKDPRYEPRLVGNDRALEGWRCTLFPSVAKRGEQRPAGHENEDQ